ncbi:HAMP domain-containing sensor histidine kinase [Celeribacter neptunius]|uniref:histidine kinase n=1 Tax=Celeribacter neptunius TaxID=588602 RepID=A0A1I3RDI8_9RHOB|nr:HAMP domain-containing sensor histidine kinase [Celeribacter neptunius]SFJ43266.1 Signal transduction histidine kinase [Celeribacter neptunius]
MSRRWRPSLGFVIGGGLSGALLVSLLGLVALRYLGPEIGFRKAAVILAIGILVTTATLGWLMVRLLLRPIAQLRDYAASHEAGQIAPRPQHFGTQEITQTAEAVISMTEALRDREATVRSFTDHVVHELKTPISAIRAATELLEDSATLIGEDAGLLQQLDGARAQIEAQLESLRAIARARETRYIGKVSLGDVVASLRDQFTDVAVICAAPQEPLPMAIEGVQLVCSQLLRNAREHGASRVELSCSERAGRVILDVKDNGDGVSPGHAAHVFEPFFTSRRQAGGTGMGLAITRNVLKAHGAKIELLSASRGAHFRISF